MTLHLTGPALQFFQTRRSLQPARQVNGVVSRQRRSPKKQQRRGLDENASPWRGLSGLDKLLALLLHDFDVVYVTHQHPERRVAGRFDSSGDADYFPLETL